MKKSLALLLSLALSASAWANMPAQPEKCPSPAAIAKIDFATAQKSTDGTYGAIQFNKYDTSELWGFIIAEIQANSQQDAMAKAKNALQSLVLLSGPDYFSTNSIWGCVYGVAEGYPVMAVTPLPSGVKDPNGLIKSLR